GARGPGATRGARLVWPSAPALRSPRVETFCSPPTLPRLFDVLSALPGRPGELRSFVAAAPPVGALPSPSLTWPLLGLLHYLLRKRWAWGVIRQRLRAQLRRPEKRRVAVTPALATLPRGIVPRPPHP